MTKLIGISGSLRQGSYNAARLRAAAKLMPGGAELTVGPIKGIPLHDADQESAELAQNAWLPVLRTLGLALWSEGRLLVSRAQGVFGADGTLADPKLAEQLRTFLQGFVAFVRSSGRGPSV